MNALNEVISDTYKRFDNSGYERGEESTNLDTKFVAGITHTSSQHASKDISSAVLIRNTAVGDGNSQSSDVIRDDSIGSVDTVFIFVTKFAFIRSCASKLLNLGKYGSENVCIVVGRDVVEYGNKSFETHSSVYVLGRKCSQFTRGLTVVLDENVVPDLKDIGVIGVDKVSGVSATDSVKMDFTVNPSKLTLISTEANYTHLQGPQGPVAPISMSRQKDATKSMNCHTYPRSCPLRCQEECGSLARQDLSKFA